MTWNDGWPQAVLATFGQSKWVSDPNPLKCAETAFLRNWWRSFPFVRMGYLILIRTERETLPEFIYEETRIFLSKDNLLIR
jgi:hypothetical protein